jgi:plastocyanin
MTRAGEGAPDKEGLVTRTRVAACIAAGALLAVPTAAEAATKTVDMGTPAKASKKFQNVGADVNDFFLHSVTIRAGDSVKFRPFGFHTADFPPKGGGGVPLIVPNGQKVANSLDAANVAFWFNGLDQVGFNPELLASGFGKRFTYNGNKRVNSGLPLAAAPKPMTVKFPKKGKYTYLCDVHPGMDGQVVVKGKGAKIPTAKQDKRRLNNQIATALKRAKKLPSTKPPANTAYLGGSAKGGVEYFGMLPETLTVKAGTTVTFAMSPRSYEVHTATLGPGNPGSEPSSYLGQIAATFEGAPVLDPRGVYPSEPPGTTATFTSALHGNGFWNSGILDQSSASAQLPASNVVRFGAAGTYDYYCIIHPFMHGQVVVTP